MEIVETPALCQDDDVKELVAKLWNRVFAESSRVIVHAAKFGFTGMEVIPDPNIHAILVRLEVFIAVIEVLLKPGVAEQFDDEDVRLLCNSHRQMNGMKSVAAALKVDDRDGFYRAVKALETQAPF